jgi:toxin secretion/phage lysis holin
LLFYNNNFLHLHFSFVKGGEKKMKYSVISALGLFGSWIASLFGGWSAGLTVLCIFMLIDLITGFLLAGVFKKSNKTENGAYESRAGWKGLARKGTTLLLILVASQCDELIGGTFIKDGVCIAFIVNEVVSIIENAGLMGVPIPKVLTNAIEVLKDKSIGADKNE